MGAVGIELTADGVLLGPRSSEHPETVAEITPIPRPVLPVWPYRRSIMHRRFCSNCGTKLNSTDWTYPAYQLFAGRWAAGYLLRRWVGGVVGRKAGTTNFSEAEATALRAVVEQGVSIGEASRALNRSYWTLRAHARRLGLSLRPPEWNPRRRRPGPPPGAAARRARLRQLEDQLIRELAGKGWSSGMAAIELDLDQSVLWRHSQRLGVTWTRYGGRSVRGEPAAAAAELRRLREAVRRDRGRWPA
jgi:hypothetical protein